MPRLAGQALETRKAFALKLETACGDFEALQGLIRGDIHVGPTVNCTNGTAAGRLKMPHSLHATGRIRMALAQSFLFNAVRARRICEHGARDLGLLRADRTRFLKSTAALGEVRNVNEHGFDVLKNRSKPSMHEHPTESAILDETSLIILGAEKILMGPLNLYSIYEPVAEMRRIAGFAAIWHVQPE